MYSFKSENVNKLEAHNIRITELNSSPSGSTSTMAQPPRKVLHLPKVRMLSRGGGRVPTGIRITNVKSIRPPDTEIVKKQEEDKLRAQLQREIVSRSRTCSVAGYSCPLPAVGGGRGCARHAAREPGAPYRACAHRRCSLPAPRNDNDPSHPGLCFEHARAAMIARQRSAAPPPPVTTSETLLNQLQHYVKLERPRTTSCASPVSVVSEPSDYEPTAPQPVDPFKQIDALSVNAAFSSSIMECGSGSDSDSDSVTIGPGGSCRGAAVDSLSDTEDAPTEERPLWRAGVFTAEEAVREAKITLESLQAAYIRQMDHLRVQLKSARQRYLKELKAEKEVHCSIHSQVAGGVSPHERRQLRKLKAMASYHRPHKHNAVLARKLLRKRAKVNEVPSNRPLPPQVRCTYTEEGARCAGPVLPASKYCLKHILHDRNQVLFHQCGDLRGSVACREPVARLPLSSSSCRYHTTPPAYTVFTLKKDDSDSQGTSDSESSDSAPDAEQSTEDRPDPEPHGNYDTQFVSQ